MEILSGIGFISEIENEHGDDDFDDLTDDERAQLEDYFRTDSSDSDSTINLGRSLVLISFISRSKGINRKRKHPETIVFIYDKIMKVSYRVVDGEIKNIIKSPLKADELIYEALEILPLSERTQERLLCELGY